MIKLARRSCKPMKCRPAIREGFSRFALLVAQVLTDIASGSSLRSGRGNSQLSDAAVAAAARDDAACAQRPLEVVAEEEDMGSAQPVGHHAGEQQHHQQQQQQQEGDPIGGDHQDESQGAATGTGRCKAGDSNDVGNKGQKGEAPGLKTRRSSGALHIMADAAGARSGACC